MLPILRQGSVPLDSTVFINNEMAHGHSEVETPDPKSPTLGPDSSLQLDCVSVFRACEQVLHHNSWSSPRMACLRITRVHICFHLRRLKVDGENYINWPITLPKHLKSALS